MNVQEDTVSALVAMATNDDVVVSLRLWTVRVDWMTPSEGPCSVTSYFTWKSTQIGRVRFAY